MKSHAYIHTFLDRHGKRRYYFRRFGTRTALPGKPDEPAFNHAYADALKASTALRSMRAASPQSIATLIRVCRTTPQYLSCKASTLRNYEQALREIEDAWGQYPVPGLTRAKVNELMANRADDPKRANRLHKRLRALMELAVDLGWITVNPVARHRPFKVKVVGFRAWPEDQIAKFHARWPRETKERVAFDLLLYLGQRSIDTVAMARNQLDGTDAICVVQEKTGATLWLPLHADLQATLAAGPVGSRYFIETAAGAPRSIKGFYVWLKSAIRAAGCDDDLSPHGLRGAAATRLIDAGATGAQVCAITGHRSLKEMERYVRDRNQRVLARSAIDMLEQNKNRKWQTL